MLVSVFVEPELPPSFDREGGAAAIELDTRSALRSLAYTRLLSKLLAKFISVFLGPEPPLSFDRETAFSEANLFMSPLTGDVIFGSAGWAAVMFVDAVTTDLEVLTTTLVVEDVTTLFI